MSGATCGLNQAKLMWYQLRMTQIKGMLFICLYSSLKMHLRGTPQTQGKLTLLLFSQRSNSAKEFKINFQGNGVYGPRSSGGIPVNSVTLA